MMRGKRSEDERTVLRDGTPRSRKCTLDRHPSSQKAYEAPEVVPASVRIDHSPLHGLGQLYSAELVSTSLAPAAAPARTATASSAKSSTRDEASSRDEVSILSGLDDATGVIEALEKAYIRFVRSAWVQKQPEDYRIENRQKLEERERQGESPTPLMQPAEAVALVRRGDRSAGVTSHGWLSPGNVRTRKTRDPARRAERPRLTEAIG